MLKLSSAIGGWRPTAQTSAGDPLALLAAGWSDIVGAEVAANSAPARVANGTLVVVTCSSAWSHQLSFLQDRVLGAIAARLPHAGVERLRFRVGTLPKRRPLPRAPHAPAPVVRGAPEAHEPAATAAEALERFRARVVRSQGAKRTAGWRDCASCAALLPPAHPGLWCAACSARREEEIEHATARLLYDAPWLGFAGTAALVDGLQKEEYEQIRRRLLRRWWGMLERSRAAGRLSRDGRERLVASSYVVLRSQLPPESILPATVRSVLGDELHDLLYGEERRV